MDPRLRQAAQDGDIEAFYNLVRMEPYILEDIDGIPFVETPLHVAASLGHTEFAMEMMRLKPSFVRKPNQDGFTPIHLALQNENISQQLHVMALVHVDPDLVRVKGREGETPLHYVAQKGKLDLLAKFLLVCPDSLKDVTIRNETALHIALKYNMVEAFRVLFGWLDRAPYDNTLGLKETILNWKNNEGNTVLHIATSNNLPQVVRALLRSRVAVNKKNLSGLTALDILECQRPLDNQEIKDMLHRAKALRASAVDTKSHIILADYLRSKESFNEAVLKSIYRVTFYMPSGKRNAFLVVAVLIATATYQAGLSPPGGVWQDDYNPTDLNTTISPSSSSPLPHHVGKTVLSPLTFFFISFSNSIAFCLSVTIIFILLPVGLYGGLLRTTIFILYACYLTSMAVISQGQVSMIMFWGLLVTSSGLVLYGVFWFSLLDTDTLRSPGARRFGTLPDLVPRKGKNHPWLLLY